MKPGSALVTVMHSPMKFVAISNATQHLQGRYIGFVGDCTATKDPTSIILPQQKTWRWEMTLVATDAAAMAAYYAEDNTRRGNLWAPTIVGNEGGEGVILAIPVVLFQALRAEKKPLMPCEAYKITMGIVNAAQDVDNAQADWDLVLSWCLLAAQLNLVGNSSHLNLAVEAVTEGGEEYFVKWIDQRLDSTLGPRPNLGPGRTANMGTTRQNFRRSWHWRWEMGLPLDYGQLGMAKANQCTWTEDTIPALERDTPRTTLPP